MRQSVFLAALLALCAPVAAQAGDVAGTVYDARGQAAAGVELVLGNARTVSGADGSYRFADVAAGEHTVSAGSQRVGVSVAETGETRRNIILLSRTARIAVTGEALPATQNDAVLADAMRMADALLAEAAALPARRWNDIGG
ncbi:carboxypeptidase-like regulatory domain-containing protein [Alteraurantiacibacter palmitatis]|uniref:Carboxypeptidase-like regulatory domain-containing protein n=1 Tax=Alteraurantiacibacter palmitatis TaxID=2054628 RepID=A0ABV7E3Z6_9SPHN